MKRKIKILTFAYLLFLLFNTLAGIMDGIASDLLVAAAFILPVFAAFAIIGADERQNADICILKLNSEGRDLFLALGMPTIAAVAGLSYLTAILMYHTLGISDTVELPDSYLVAIISLALGPALVEELLFRYLPMKLLLPHSARVTVILSSVAFALAHCNLFQLGYALIAGAMFVILDIAAKSILPSIILHFINNLISVTVLYYRGDLTVINALNVIICLLLVASISYLIVKRKFVICKILLAASAEEEFRFDNTLLFYIIPALLLSVFDLFSKLGG